MAQYQAVPPQAPADYPGKTLGIVGLVLAIVGSVVGLIISVVAFNQSKAAGYQNGIAKAGIIVGIITTVLTVLYIVFVVVLLANATPNY
jgi:hypothetical protein